MKNSNFGKTLFLLLLIMCFTNAWAENSQYQGETQLWSSSSYTIDNNALRLSSEVTTPAFKLVGNAEFSYLFWDVYDSYLFSPNGKMDANKDWFTQTPVALEIRYKRDIKAKDLIDSTIEQWQHLKYSNKDYERYVPWLNEVWPNLKDGDRLALIVFKDFSVFFYNKRFLALQPDPKFGKVFIDIWLSAQTSEPKLRKQLLSSSQ